MLASFSQDKKVYTRFFTTLLLLYFLVFSCFALYHAYSENEILDSHECAIGLWVQHGQATLTFFAALAVFLLAVSSNPIHRRSFIFQFQASQIFPRGPPFFS
ncbi:hypothetical protein JYT17_00285 [Nitrospira defluvii]|nr:hypothetical protein [Nitrospira defluvii]